MTGRKSTRAASSRASSVGRSDLGQATPRRSTRSQALFEGSPLPPPLPPLASVPNRASTSYGSSIAPLPVEFRRFGRGGDLTETLTDILGTVQENIQATYGYTQNPTEQPNDAEPQAAAGNQAGGRGKGRRATSTAASGSSAPVPKYTPATRRSTRHGQGTSEMSTPSVNNTISYINESELYGNATFTEDMNATPRRSDRKFARTLTEDDDEEDDEQHVIEPLIERASLWVRLIAYLGSLYTLITSGVATSAARLFGTLSSLVHRSFSRWHMIVLVLVVLGIAGFFNTSTTTDSLLENDYKPTSPKISDRIRQWIPFSISNPLSYINDLDLSALQGRLSVVEKDVDFLKKHVVLHREAVDYLKKILPDNMYLPNEGGEPEPPPSFWKGLAQGPKGSKDKSETVPNSDWDDFIAQNEAKVKLWLEEKSEDLWGQHLKKSLLNGGVLVSKDEVIEMIKNRWDRSELNIRNQIKEELGNLDKFFSHKGFIKQQDAIDLIKEMTIKALAKSEDLKTVAFYQLQRPNHFSFGLGAVVNPSFTSPTYAFAKARAWWPKRLILWSIGYGLPTPNPPSEALRQWYEAGDCWCSPVEGSGAGVQLGVLMANDIFPKSVVIEHVPKSATLDPSSAPREMELLAQIDGYKATGIVGEMSDHIFPDFNEPFLGREWILIGKMHYDIDNDDNVQHFYPQVDLQNLGVSTRQLVVRVKSNYGNSDHTCLYRVRVHGEVASLRDSA